MNGIKFTAPIMPRQVGTLFILTGPYQTGFAVYRKPNFFHLWMMRLCFGWKYEALK